MLITPNLSIPYIDVNEAQREVVHNEAIRGLDALVQLAVLDRDLATPPGSPDDGDRYIVAASPTGAWSGHADDIAAWQDGTWRFFTPRIGWLAYVVDEEELLAWDGDAWVTAVEALGGGGGGSGGSGDCVKIAESHSGNAATFAIKALDGNDPSPSNPVTVIFPDGTQRTIMAALSLTIPSTATMGAANGTAFALWFCLVDDSGTLRLGVRNCSDVYGVCPFPGHGVLTSTTIGTGADSAGVTYTDTGTTAKPFVIVGFADYDSGLTTAGTWDAAPTRVTLYAPGMAKPGDVVQIKQATQGTEQSTTSSTYADVTGMSVSITPQRKQNRVEFSQGANCWSATLNNYAVVRMMRDATQIGTVSEVGGPANIAASFMTSVLDSPYSTSALNYHVESKSINNTNAILYPGTSSLQGGVGVVCVKEIMG